MLPITYQKKEKRRKRLNCQPYAVVNVKNTMIWDQKNASTPAGLPKAYDSSVSQAAHVAFSDPMRVQAHQKVSSTASQPMEAYAE